jgi:ABC-2 type transport system ATP-binding protein
MHPVLSIQNLSKNYGQVQALKEVSFDVPRGSVYGILGPNGSGKTTLLGIVMDILKASSGNFLWNGQPCSHEQRRLIGTLLETPNFYHYLTGQQNLEIAAAIKQRGKEDIPRVLDIVNLTARKDSKFSTYSLGMKQRLAIASTLLGDPDIMVFDEPTNGLDPAGIAEIRELIRKLNRDGKTIIMASHILDEVERVCTHVAIIQKGILKTSGTVAGVLDHTPESTEAALIEVDLAAENMELLRQSLETLTGVQSIAGHDNILTVTCTADLNATELNRFCFDKGIVLNHLSLKRKTLEKRFLEITGNTSDR